MDDTQLLRYSRQIMLPDIDIAGQEALLSAHVLIIGMGGLGCPVAQYLAAAGVGQLTICDDDQVELSNLQRQILHHDADIGRPKVASAADSIKVINPGVKVRAIQRRIDEDELHTLAAEVDLVVDATDNFATRFAINAACIATQTPAVFGAAVRLEGQIMIYDPSQDSSCYACLHKHGSEETLNCATSGIAAPVVGIIGGMQAMEALKLLTGIAPSSAGFLQLFDAKQMSWQKFKLPKRQDCEACGTKK